MRTAARRRRRTVESTLASWPLPVRAKERAPTASCVVEMLMSPQRRARRELLPGCGARASSVRARCNRRANRRPAGKTPADAGRWTAVSDIWLNPWRVSPADPRLLTRCSWPKPGCLRTRPWPARYMQSPDFDGHAARSATTSDAAPRRPRCTSSAAPALSRCRIPATKSSAAFDWGFVSAGALELSFALLADTTESRPTELVCRAFCAEVVALPGARKLRADRR